MQNKNTTIIIILLVIAVGILAFTAFKKPKTDTQTSGENTPIAQSGLKEYRNDDIGVLFWYPKSYGEVVVGTVKKDPNGVAPFNIQEITDPDGEPTNLRSFSAKFSQTNDLQFGGGFDCVGCDGGLYHGDFVFRYPPYPQIADRYQRFYTNSGSVGLLTRGILKPGAVCDDLGCTGFDHEGDFHVTFRVDTDYRGVTFYGKENSENTAVLKSLIILSDTETPD